MKKNELDKDYKPNNSSMVENEEDMKKLGKQIEKLRTNKELKADDKYPDPIQHEN